MFFLEGVNNKINCMRNKMFFWLIIGIISLLIIDSCKKGSEDPAISFRSRNNRICQHWKLVSIAGTSIVNNIVNYNYSYLGNDYVEITPWDTNSYNAYNFEMKINKDNTLEITENYNNTNGTPISNTSKYYWNWVDGKEKSIINLSFNNSVILEADYWEVNKLSHKEIILYYYYSDVENGFNNSKEYTLTFNLIK